MDDADRDRHATSFDAAAAAYQRARPSYPAEAVDWLLPGRARRVCDLGAGTGKLTADLVGRGLDVVAVEPLDGMRARLAAELPEVDARAGTAEDIPLPDAAVDAVLVAQAWHWFDQDRAGAEVARVLRPGGVLGLVWNVRDEREPWTAELSELIRSGDSTGQYGRQLTDSPYFGPVDSHSFYHRHTLDLAGLLDTVRSRSYVILLPEPDRAALLDRVTELTRTHPALAGRTAFDLPYRTDCFRAHRR